MTETYSPFSPEQELFDRFCERMSDRCFETEVGYEEETVVSYLSELTEENFESRFQQCFKRLRSLNYQPQPLG